MGKEEMVFNAPKGGIALPRGETVYIGGMISFPLRETPLEDEVPSVLTRFLRRLFSQRRSR